MTGSRVKGGKPVRQKRSKTRKKTGTLNHDRFIPGFHGVRETLKARGETLQEVWIAKGKQSLRTEEISELAASGNIPIYFKDEHHLTDIFGHIAHQGIVGVTKAIVYGDLAEIGRHALKEGASALLLAADHITDPGNLGALIRTAAFFGCHGLIIPRDRSAGITPGTLKRASGTHLKLPVARVTNLGRTLDDLSDEGFWIVGAAGEAGLSIYDFDWKRPLVLVLGGEQKGIAPSVRKRCHQLVTIPSPGGVESLNVSTAGGVILSEICRQRATVKC